MSTYQNQQRPPYVAEGVYRFEITGIRKKFKAEKNRTYAIVEGKVVKAQAGAKTPEGPATVMFSISTKGGERDLGELVSALDPEHFGPGKESDLDKLVDNNVGRTLFVKAEVIKVGPNKDRDFTKYSFKPAN